MPQYFTFPNTAVEKKTTIMSELHDITGFPNRVHTCGCNSLPFKGSCLPNLVIWDSRAELIRMWRIYQCRFYTVVHTEWVSLIKVCV